MLKRILLLALTAVLLLALLPVTAVADDGAVAMSVTVGYGGRYVVGKATPVLVTIKNDGGEIPGTIELRTGTGFGILVSRPVVLPPNTEKRFVLFVQAAAIYQKKDFEVKLKTNSGATVCTAAPAYIAGIDPDKSLCGILSDDSAALAYMKKIIFNQSAIKEWVDLTGDTIYETPGLLDSFDVLAINRFDAGKLTDLQRAAIQQWVYGGGDLILGTGPSGVASVGRWQDLVGGLTFGASGTATDLAELSAMAQGREYKSSLPIVAIQSEGWETVARAEENKPLVLRRQFGRGSVVVTAFDMGEGAMGSWEGNSLLWQRLVGGAPPSMYGNSYYQYGMYGGYEGISTALQGGLIGGSVTFWLFLLLLVAFIALAGFISFAILRRMGRQRLMWVTIPALAVLFSALLLFCGRNSLGRRPYTFAFTLMNISGGVALSESTLAFVAPAMGDYDLVVDAPGLLFPMDSNPNYYYNMPGSATANKQPITAVTRADGAQLEYLSVNLNGSRLARYSSFSGRAPLEMKYVYDGSSVKCTVQNVSEWTVGDVTVAIGKDFRTIGAMAPGAEEEVTLPLDQTPLDQSVWELVDKIYPNYYGGGMFASRNTPANAETAMKAAFLREAANSIATTGSVPADALGQVFCFGWIDKPFDYPVKVNGREVKPKSLTLASALTPITQLETGDGKLEIVKSFGQINASLTASGGANMKDNILMLEPGSTAVLDFSLAEAGNLQLSGLFFEAGQRNGGGSGSWSIYNWGTQTWDAADATRRFSEVEIAKYIDAGGIIRIKLSAGANEYIEGQPYVWVQGVKK